MKRESPPPPQKSPWVAEPTKQQPGCLQVGCGALVIVMVVGMIAGQCAGDSASSTTAERSVSDDNSSMAYVMCQDFVKRGLRAPGTAKFPGMFEQTYSDATTRLEGGKYRVRSWVDAQNGFGALIRTNYVCEIEHTAGDNWRLVDVNTY